MNCKISKIALPDLPRGLTKEVFTVRGVQQGAHPPALAR